MPVSPVPPGGQQPGDIHRDEPKKLKDENKPFVIPDNKNIQKITTDPSKIHPLPPNPEVENLRPVFNLISALQQKPPNNMQTLKMCDELEKKIQEFRDHNGKPTKNPTEEQVAAQALIQTQIDVIRESIKNNVPITPPSAEEQMVMFNAFSTVHPTPFIPPAPPPGGYGSTEETTTGS